MDKQQSSRLINRYTGGNPDEMFCYRVWLNAKLWGGFWLPLAVTIDIGFYIIRRKTQHCRATYLLQRRQNNAQAHKSSDGAPQEEAGA